MAFKDGSCDLTHVRINNIINQVMEDISRVYKVVIHYVFLPRTLTYNIYCNHMCMMFNEFDLWKYTYSEILDLIIQKFNLDDDIGELNNDNEQAFIDAGEDLIFGGIMIW